MVLDAPIRSVISPPPEDTGWTAARAEDRSLVATPLIVFRRYPEVFLFLGAIQWVFPGLIAAVCHGVAQRVGEVLGSLTAVVFVTAAQTTTQTIVTGASDALAVAEQYDQIAHTHATEYMGKPGALLYETTRTGVLAALVGPFLYRQLA